MPPFTQNKTDDKSRTYVVSYNRTTIVDNYHDLEAAISFAYGLHQNTLQTEHHIEVRRKDFENMSLSYAEFTTSHYWDDLDRSIEPKESL